MARVFLVFVLLLSWGPGAFAKPGVARAPAAAAPTPAPAAPTPAPAAPAPEAPAPVTPPAATPPAAPVTPPAAPPSIKVQDPDADCDGECCPATTREKIVVAGSGFAMFAVFFVLFRAAMVSALIRKDWSPGLASHTALSTALFAASIGTSLTAYVVKGCWLFGFTALTGLMFGVWALHLVFTLVAVRGSR